MFRRGLVAATLAGAAMSLFIEAAQRTGVRGLLPCAYRLFDVDDLMANGLGAVAGSIVALVFVRRRPSAIDPSRPRALTAGRRLLGMLCDVLFLALLGAMSAIGWRAWQMHAQHIPCEQLDQGIQVLLGVWVPLSVQVVWILASGQTIGESVTLLRGRPVRISSVLARPLRFIAGIGGYGSLARLSFPFSGLLLAVLEIEDARIRDRVWGGVPS